MVREVASKTSDVAGDGTTTATVLAQAIYREGHKQVTAGHNGDQAGYGAGRRASWTAARALSRDVKNKQEIAQVGTIAANHDQVIGDLIAEAMEQVGKMASSRWKKATPPRRLRIVEDAARSWLSLAVLRHQCRAHGSRVENPYILLHEKKLSHLQELLPVLEQVAHAGAPMLIIAEDVEGEPDVGGQLSCVARSSVRRSRRRGSASAARR